MVLSRKKDINEASVVSLFYLQYSTKSVSVEKLHFYDIFNLQSTYLKQLSEYALEDNADIMKWHFSIFEKSDTRIKTPKVTITTQYSSKISCIE